MSGIIFYYANLSFGVSCKEKGAMQPKLFHLDCGVCIPLNSIAINTFLLKLNAAFRSIHLDASRIYYRHIYIFHGPKVDKTRHFV